MKKYLAIFALLASTMAHAQFGGNDYNSGDVRRAMPVEMGMVIDVVSSKIDVQPSGTQRGIGAAASGLLCGLGTSKMTDWSARASVVGLCGLAGERLGAAFGGETRKATTLMVVLANKNVIAVAQEDPNIVTGSLVYVLSGSGATRVLLASQQAGIGK